MREIATIADLAALAGQPIGDSEWLTVDQRMIDDFAQVTGDRQWIHVDVERARREAPGGHTVAHGFLTLSLLPRLQQSIYRIVHRSRGVNYGLDRVRFVSPVAAGARIRLHLVLDRAEAVTGATRLFFTATVEVEGHDRPALVAQTIAQLFD